MYETYWDLKQKPFENTTDPRFYYPGESHQAALLKLRYALENHRGAAMLSGPSGVGKTLLTSMLSEVLGEGFRPTVRLLFPPMPTPDLLAYVADELEGTAALATPSIQASVRRIERFLTSNSEQGRNAVLVVDEAHLLEGVETFEALRLLLNFAPEGTPALSILLVGEPTLLPMIDRMPQWEERLAVKCLLRPFTEAETAAYVEHRLRVAGASRPIVTPEAIETLHVLTNGIPRRINRLCDLALLIGFAEEQPILSASHFEAVCRELVAVAPE